MWRQSKDANLNVRYLIHLTWHLITNQEVPNLFAGTFWSGIVTELGSSRLIRISWYYKQVQTNIIDNQIDYKTRTFFDTITQASHTSPSANSAPITGRGKRPESQPVSSGRLSIENGQHCNGKLLMKYNSVTFFA